MFFGLSMFFDSLHLQGIIHLHSIFVMTLGNWLHFAIFLIRVYVDLQDLFVFFQDLPIQKLVIIALIGQEFPLCLKLLIILSLTGYLSAHLLQLHNVIRYFLLYFIPQLLHQVLLDILHPPLQYFNIRFLNNLQLPLQSSDSTMQSAILLLQFLIFSFDDGKLKIETGDLCQVLLLNLIEPFHDG